LIFRGKFSTAKNPRESLARANQTRIEFQEILEIAIGNNGGNLFNNKAAVSRILLFNSAPGHFLVGRIDLDIVGIGPGIFKTFMAIALFDQDADLFVKKRYFILRHTPALCLIKTLQKVWPNWAINASFIIMLKVKKKAPAEIDRDF
jgi:hypothetical protein